MREPDLRTTTANEMPRKQSENKNHVKKQIITESKAKKQIFIVGSSMMENGTCTGVSRDHTVKMTTF